MSVQTTEQTKLSPLDARKKFVHALADGKSEEAMRYLMLCPIDPDLALVIKEVSGMAMLKNFDLSEAKKVYPDEFA